MNWSLSKLMATGGRDVYEQLEKEPTVLLTGHLVLQQNAILVMDSNNSIGSCRYE